MNEVARANKLHIAAANNLTLNAVYCELERKTAWIDWSQANESEIEDWKLKSQ